jgi:hypothetical protein
MKPKFRAWDPQRKCMETTFVISSQGYVSFTPLGLQQRDLDYYEIMTAAGVKDKHGTDVYKGYIIKSTCGHHTWIYEVKTVDGFGNNLYLVTRYRNFETSEDGDEYIWGDFYVNEGRNEISGCNHMEIIGNIYEGVGGKPWQSQ